MKLNVFLTGLLLAVSATSALASGPYLAASGGVSFFHDGDMKSSGTPTITIDYDRGTGLSLSVGARFNGGGRIEGEFGYRTAEVSKLSALGRSVSISGVDATVKSYMINGFYDFNSEATVSPFLGGGIGLMNYALKDSGSTEDASSFGYQLIAGVGFNLNKTATIDLSYRFQGAASDFERGGDTISYLNSSVFGGLRLNF